MEQEMVTRYLPLDRVIEIVSLRSRLSNQYQTERGTRQSAGDPDVAARFSYQHGRIQNQALVDAFVFRLGTLTARTVVTCQQAMDQSSSARANFTTLTEP